MRLLLLMVVIASPLYAQHKAPHSDAATGASPFRIWQNLRHSESCGLLHGLVQRMDAEVTGEHRDPAVWRTDVGNCELTIGVQTEANVESEIAVGFFRDPRWWIASPVHIRTVRGAGVHRLKGLRPGKYYIGAMAGELPYPHAVGVHLGWPGAVDVRADSNQRARILVSREFKWDLAPQITFNRTESRSAAKKERFEAGKTDRLICVNVIDEAGEPERYCQVDVTEHQQRGADPGVHPVVHRDGTNSDGSVYFTLTDMDVDLSVQVKRFDFTTVPLVTRYHEYATGQRYRPGVGETLTIECDAMSPTGSTSIAGQVQDQDSRPVELLEVEIYSIGKAHDPKAGRREVRRRTVIVTGDSGEFVLSGLTPGPHRIHVLPLDSEAYVQHWPGQELTIPEAAPANIDISIELQRREFYYGMIVRADGSAAYPFRGVASISGPEVEDINWRGVWLNTRRDGSFRIAVSKAEAQLLNRHSDNLFTVHHVDKQEPRITFDYRTLSQDEEDPTQIHFPE